MGIFKPILDDSWKIPYRRERKKQLDVDCCSLHELPPHHVSISRGLIVALFSSFHAMISWFLAFHFFPHSLRMQ
ncbi:hypothetical protein NC653_020015 [Populus alba x Populus x berolinensis]|uniref:Uncharacterized protein n=1 Tax=Populus alba x Populus x berolinensis TaxID=444605 RepID=A0AAD6MJI6_9ROSI|nr:hypothetical protein NC653_020015 [Populus alba x Populus x berolinensis]